MAGTFSKWFHVEVPTTSKPTMMATAAMDTIPTHLYYMETTQPPLIFIKDAKFPNEISCSNNQQQQYLLPLTTISSSLGGGGGPALGLLINLASFACLVLEVDRTFAR